MTHISEKYILNSEQDSSNLAQKIAKQISLGDILTFSGNLGSGKTFFCRQIIKFLCGKDTKVTSPTFNLLQTYKAPNFEIYHFDLYRLKYQEEIYELGIEEAIAHGVCLIEWPEIILEILPKDIIQIRLSILTDSQRELIIIK